MVVLKTCVLKIYYCPCKGCNRILVEVGQFLQVQQIDRDAEKHEASILVTGDPDKVIKALKNHRSRVEYFEHTLAMNKVTKSQLVIPPKPFQVVAQPPDQTIVKKTKVCCPECNHELELKRPCYACGKAIRGYFYRCKSEELDLHLHPCCSNLKRKLYEMDFVPRDKKIPSSSKSVCCENKMRRGSCSYISTCEKYHFHVYCIPKMLHKAWKKGVINVSTSPKTMDLQPRKPNNSNRKGGRFGEILKTLSIFAGALVGILLGDPTGLIGGVLIDLFWNMLLPKFPPKLPSK